MPFIRCKCWLRKLYRKYHPSSTIYGYFRWNLYTLRLSVQASFYFTFLFFSCGKQKKHNAIQMFIFSLLYKPNYKAYCYVLRYKPYSSARKYKKRLDVYSIKSNESQRNDTPCIVKALNWGYCIMLI